MNKSPNDNQATAQLINYILHLADNALILGHRNSEWCGHAPVLEQDIAISNIALDLIGQARNFYQYAAILINQSTPAQAEATEDTLAYLRDAREFKNCLLVEQPNGDWAVTILRQFFFSTYQYYLYQQLVNSADKQIAAIAEKALKEVTYHVRWSSEWVIRLGDGTAESHNRILLAVEKLGRFTNELFIPADYESCAGDYGTDINLLREPWLQKIKAVFTQATIENTLPLNEAWSGMLGKNGLHTEHLGYILAEMQFLQRAYPGATW